ncbi:hypothetical protein [Nocardia sp. NPDC060249]|uniref:hypothetical protein n=1 Tax=Nocardia sp. NPDC060249 TaxID=3347082 RepID=UPI003647121D
MRVVRLTVAVTGSPTTPPTSIDAVADNAQTATDLAFNQGHQFPLGDWLMVDVVPTTDPSTADLTIDADSTPTLTDLANTVRTGLGLPPRDNPTVTPDDMHRLGSDISRADLARTTIPSWADQHASPTTQVDSTISATPDTNPNTTPDLDTDTTVDLDAIHNNHAEQTPAGVSHHRGDPTMGDLPHRVPADPNRFTADTHITPDGHAVVGGRTLTPEQYGDLLRRSGWDGVTPIRLIGCDASTNGFADRLAQHLGVEVLAPTQAAWTDSNGNVFSATAVTNPDGTRSPRIPPDGQWTTHNPDTTTRSHGTDPQAPGSTAGPLRPNTAIDRSADETTGRTDEDDDYDDPPPARTIPPDEPGHDRRFVDWNRPTHRPPDPADPSAPPRPIDVHDEISAPHRDRENVPDGNTRPEELQPIENPNPVPLPLRDHQPLSPWTAYPVRNENGTRTTFFTDGNGTVKWVEAEGGSKDKAVHPHGAWSGFNPDLGYPLLPDVQYRVPNTHNDAKFIDVHTDRHGQPDAMTAEVEAGGQNPKYRDDDSKKGAQKRAYQEGEAAYPSNPSGRDLTPEEIEDSRIKWAGGHLLANELGGIGEYLNMHGQMAASNSGNDRDGWNYAASWRAQESALADFAGEAHQDIRNYQVSAPRASNGVPDEVVMRWQEVIFSRNPDGTVQIGPDNEPVVESIETRERVFTNIAGSAHFGPPTRYYGR